MKLGTANKKTFNTQRWCELIEKGGRREKERVSEGERE